jgi:hypothetical protein
MPLEHKSVRPVVAAKMARQKPYKNECEAALLRGSNEKHELRLGLEMTLLACSEKTTWAALQHMCME